MLAEIIAFFFGSGIGWLCCYMVRAISNPLDLDFDCERVDFLQTSGCDVIVTDLGWRVTNHAEVSNKRPATDIRSAIDSARRESGWV